MKFKKPDVTILLHDQVTFEKPGMELVANCIVTVYHYHSKSMFIAKNMDLIWTYHGLTMDLPRRFVE